MKKLFLVAIFFSFPIFVFAQTYPVKPVTIVAPFSAGGSADLLARILSEKLTPVFNQPVVVENKVGAGGTIGANFVAKALPDGYTLLLGVTATQTIAPSFYKNLPYNSEKDFKPIGLVAQIPVVFVINSELKINSAKDFVATAKKSGKVYSYASSGTGAIPHLTGELFQISTGIKLNHIPYKGAAPAMTDLISGRVDIMFDHLPTVLPHIKSGKLIPLAVAGSERAKALPEVPTLAEVGIPGVDVYSWFGLLAPAGTSEQISNQLNQEIQKIQKMDDVKAKLANMGAEPVVVSSDNFKKLIDSDIKKWSKLIKTTGIQSE